MKIRVTFKDPDVVGDAIDEAVGEEVAAIPGLSEEEREAVCEKRKDGISLSKWVKYGEYIEVEFDTETGTATVIPCRG